MRVVGIIGRAFSGSTLLARVASACEEVASVGELHWIIDNSERSVCTTCGADCDLFSDDLRYYPPAEKDLYSTVFSRSGKAILFSSDKTPWQYERFVAPRTMDGVFLLRSPHGVVSSILKRNIYVKRAMHNALRSYIETYGGLLGWSRGFCRRLIVIEYDDLIRDPVATIRLIADEMALGPVSKAIDLNQLHPHQLFGSRRARRSVTIEPIDKWRQRLAVGQVAEIGADTLAMDIYERIREHALHP